MVALYAPGNTIIHRVPFFVKCVVVSVVVTIIYITDNPVLLAGAGAMCVVVYAMAKLSMTYAWRCFTLVLPFVIAIAVYHTIMGNYLIAGVSAGRIIAAVLLANSISLTTSVPRIIKESEKIFFFLKYIAISPKLPGVLIGVFLRTVPLLYLEKQEIEAAAALRGRGAGVQTKRGKEAQKVKKHARIFSPTMIFSLLLRVVMQTDDVALALHMRGFSVKIYKLSRTRGEYNAKIQRK